MKKSYVKQYYAQALFELLKKKPLQEISITDLVKKAGASRASFYRNYTSKEQIIEEYLQEVFVEISRRHKFTAENMVAETGSIFAELYEHRAALSVLSKAGQLDLVDRYLYQETLDQILRLNVLNNKYQPYFFAGATSALIKAWIAFGFEESPEEMTDIFFHSLAGYMDIPNQ